MLLSNLLAFCALPAVPLTLPFVLVEGESEEDAELSSVAPLGDVAVLGSSLLLSVTLSALSELLDSAVGCAPLLSVLLSKPDLVAGAGVAELSVLTLVLVTAVSVALICFMAAIMVLCRGVLL